MAVPESTDAQTKSMPARAVTDLADGIEGKVCFSGNDEKHYRYCITVLEDTLRVWLEDLKSKQQWQSVSLMQADFVTADAVIPQATFQDYAMCFVRCLDAPLTSEDFARELLPHKDNVDGLELRLTVKIRAFLAVWQPQYSFSLEPVRLTTVELLEARIRDHDEKIQSLAVDVQELFDEVGTTPLVPVVAYTRGTLTDKFTTGQKLVWKCEGFVLSGNNGQIQVQSSGAIRFAIPGTYVVSAMIQHNNTNNGTTIELRLNHSTVVSVVDSNADGHYRTTSIYHVFMAATNDEISFVYRGNNHVERGSYLVIHQLR